MQDATPDRVLLGRISGVFGVKGWVKVYSYTDPRENIVSYDPWYVKRQGRWQAVKVEDGQPHGKGVIAKLQGCDDRDAAALLIGADIAIDREQLEAAGPGEYYWRDLIGLKVITEAGEALGTVDHLFETGANDVLVVKGERERLIPFIREQVVKSVDLERGELRVDWDPEF